MQACTPLRWLYLLTQQKGCYHELQPLLLKSPGR